ncbi:hypothetical protein C2W62_40325 [Candidatus Entotheonella serta]|nr:hypothetical protein C2W62_40325 [Candidatus Entotheonella serta]
MIQIHIERLIVDDMTLSPHQQQQFKAAVEAELIRLLTADGLALQARDHAVSSVRAGTITHAEAQDPNRLGQRIAQAVYTGINP